jgi:arylsulfatase A-like enzyme
VGVDKLDFYSPLAPAPPTPQLDHLRLKSVLFTQAYVNPICAPSRAMLQTGRYSFRTGMGTIPDSQFTLNSSEVTIAEMLKAGFPGQTSQYACGAFGKWHMTIVDPEHACANGYDRFVGTTGGYNNHFIWSETVDTPTTQATVTMIGSASGPFDTTTFSASVLRAEAASWINAQTQPFFAYVCFIPPHAPFQVPPLLLLSPATRAVIASKGYAAGDNLSGTPDEALAFDWMLEAVDTEIGNFLQAISSSKLKNSTVFVLGDNGTPSEAVHAPYDPMHAKSTVYQLGTHVPLLVSGVGAKPNTVCSALISGVDLWSTIAAITGADASEVDPGGDCANGVLDSLSFRNLMSNPAGVGVRTQCFVQLFAPEGCYVPDPVIAPDKDAHNRGMTDGTYKYIRIWNRNSSQYDEHAFDLSSDPQETNDLWPSLASLPPAASASILALKSSMLGLSGY